MYLPPLPIPHLRFPFALKAVPEGGRFAGTRSLPSQESIAQGSTFGPSPAEGALVQSIKSHELQDAKRDEKHRDNLKVHNPSQSNGEPGTDQDQYP